MASDTRNNRLRPNRALTQLILGQGHDVCRRPVERQRHVVRVRDLGHDPFTAHAPAIAQRHVGRMC